jgi:hypothetical protein
MYFIITPIVCLECHRRPLGGEINNTTFSNGSLGSRIDEERSELR